MVSRHAEEKVKVKKSKVVSKDSFCMSAFMCACMNRFWGFENVVALYGLIPLLFLTPAASCRSEFSPISLISDIKDRVG